jgi:DtxR family transcriptional regulator, Mn-dependent transcriptional regulator
MSVSELSASTQNYLKIIWNLQEWSDAPVTASQLADRLGLKLSTVSDAVRKLTEQGLVEHARYGSVTLTPVGRAHAVAMVRRHRLIETFLVQVLQYRWDEVHDEAETLEHAVSDLMVDRIDAHLGHPTRDPHGDPIPSANGVVHRPNAVQLTMAQPNTQVRVERISDADPRMLQYFADRGIVVDAQLSVLEGEPYANVVVVQVAGREHPISLGSAATNAIWVSTT